MPRRTTTSRILRHDRHRLRLSSKTLLVHHDKPQRRRRVMLLLLLSSCCTLFLQFRANAMHATRTALRPRSQHPPRRRVVVLAHQPFLHHFAPVVVNSCQQRDDGRHRNTATTLHHHRTAASKNTAAATHHSTSPLFAQRPSTARIRRIRNNPSCWYLGSYKTTTTGGSDDENDDDDYEPTTSDDDSGSKRRTATATSTTTSLSTENEQQQQPPYSSYSYYSSTAAASTLERLEEATHCLLDADRYPLGSLTASDFSRIESLLRAWPQQRSIQAGLEAERLLKRCVDELRATAAADSQQQHRFLQLTSEHYACLLEAWARAGGVEAAERAQTVHDGLVAAAAAGGNHNKNSSRVPPTLQTYGALLLAWKTSRAPKLAVEQAEKVLEEMRRHGLQPDNGTVAAVLEIYAQFLSRNNNDRGAAAAIVRRCEELVERLLGGEASAATSNATSTGSAAAAAPSGTAVNAYTWAALQTVHARSRLSDAPEKAEEILHRMLHATTTTTTTTNDNDSDDSNNSNPNYNNPLAGPLVTNYNAVLNAYSKHPNRRNAQKAAELLRRMERTPASGGGPPVGPDRVSYALAILACARCGGAWGAARAERLLLRMEGRAARERRQRLELSNCAAPPRVTLEVESFNVVLTALSQLDQHGNSGSGNRSGKNNSNSKHRPHRAPERAVAILRRMQEHAAVDEAVRPNIRSWNAILNTFARASRDGLSYARQAERIFERLSSPTSDVKPDEFTYAAMLTVYMRSGHPDAAQRAEEVVRRMEDLYEREELAAPPDTYHYTILINTYARSPGDPAPAARRVLDILVRMVERANNGFPSCRPNTRTYNSILDCLTRAGELQRAEELLYYMLGLYQRGDASAAPDAHSFNCIITAFTRSRLRDAGSRAESLLDRLIEYSEDNPAVVPEARSFNLLIAFYARSKAPDSSYRAEYILNRMVNRFKEGQINLRPSLFGFTTVIESYAYASHPDAGMNADRLLRLLRRLNDQYGAQLELKTSLLNSALFAWASCGDQDAGNRADAYLDEMEAAFTSGSFHLAPDTRSYGLALSAWSKSSSRDKHLRALSVLQRMERQEQKGNRNIKVDEHARSLVINACAFANAGPEASAEAFDIAVSVFDQIISATERPTSLSFGWFIQACGRLRGVPEERKHAQIERAFLLCRDAGLVNDFVLHRLKGASSDDLYRRLLTPGRAKRPCVNVAQLPADWKRNLSPMRQKNSGR